MTFFCFLVLFKYANIYAVGSQEASRNFARIFAFLVALLTIVPAVLALIELLKSFKHFKKICNWKRDKVDEKDEDASSEEDRNNGSVDLLKNND